MKWLYKYPQRAYPYQDLIETNRRRGRTDLEYELLDTGIFEGDHYFDVFAEYAKASPEDIFIRITAMNIGPETAESPWQREQVPGLTTYLETRVKYSPHLFDAIHPTGHGHRGYGDRGILAIVKPERLRRILSRMLDENEFLSRYGIRALSRAHLDHPYVFSVYGQEYRVSYLPAESDTGMFGGNSNWRGPIWMPTNILIIRALLTYYGYYGDSFKVECPTGSGHMMNLFEVAAEIANRLISMFLRDQSGRRPVYGGAEKFQNDPNWRDCILFFEYFHGDNGAGIGANHQTGWTGLVASLIRIFGYLTAQEFLESGRSAVFSHAKAG